MSVRSAVYNKAKVGFQSAKGTSATIDTLLDGLGFAMPEPEIRGGTMHTSAGEQFPSASVPSTKSHSMAECGGKITYNNIIRPFVTLFGNVSVSSSGTNGKLRNFAMGNLTSITRTYLTVEVGDSGRAKKVIDWFAKGLTIDLSDEKSEFKMPGLAGAIQDDTTPTTSATGAAASIVNPSGWDVFLATTAAGLDTAEGTRQVETATVAGTVTGSGNATVVVTSNVVTGSPLTVPVAVTNTDTATLVAGKIITALQANSAISAKFAIGGTGATVILTALNAAANDSSLNVSVDNGTCTGLTTAATSANTTAGVAATRFPLPFSTQLTLPDLVGLVYRMNSTDTSFTGTADLAGIPQLTIDVGDDDDDFATIIPYIASGSTLFWRICAMGGVIAGAAISRERLAIDIATKLVSGWKPSVNQGASANTFNLMGVQDATWTKMLNIQVVNTIAAITGTP